MSDVYRCLHLEGFHTIVRDAGDGHAFVAHALSQEDGEKIVAALNFLGGSVDQRIADLRERLLDRLNDAVEEFFDDLPEPSR